jgi:hypothetical protein
MSYWTLLNGLTLDGVATPLRLDTRTQKLCVINSLELATNQGKQFFINRYINTLSNNDTLLFVFKTPDYSVSGQPLIRSDVTYSANSEYLIELFEEPTFDTGDTPVVGGDYYIPKAELLNLDRNSETTPELEAWAGVPEANITDDGTYIDSGDTGLNRSASSFKGRLGAEIIAKSNTYYLFRITKKSTANDALKLTFSWREGRPVGG